MAAQVQQVTGFPVWISDHPPVDSDFDTLPNDGYVVIDLENQKLWARCRGNWVGVALA